MQRGLLLLILAVLLLAYAHGRPTREPAKAAPGAPSTPHLLAERSREYFAAVGRPSLSSFRARVLDGALKPTDPPQSAAAVYYGAKVMHARGVLTAKNFAILLRR